jgi:hypothetical protein
MQATLGLTGLTMNAMALIATRRFPLAHLLRAGDRRRNGGRPAMWIGIVFALLALFGDRSLLRGNGEAVSWHRQFVLLRGTVVSESRQGLEVRPALKVHRRLGLPSLLLDLPGVMVAVTGIFTGYIVGHALAELHERFESRADVHDAGCRHVHLRSGIHRAPRCEWLHGGQHCHQRDSDLRFDRFLRDGHRLPHEPPTGQRRLPVGFDDQ